MNDPRKGPARFHTLDLMNTLIFKRDHVPWRQYRDNSDCAVVPPKSAHCILYKRPGKGVPTSLRTGPSSMSTWTTRAWDSKVSLLPTM